jgi:hypothetical protein
MDLHMIFAGMFIFDSSGDSTKHTDSFQDMNAFALIIEDTQAKPARGGNNSLTPCQERPLNEIPMTCNEEHSGKGVNQSKGLRITPRDPIDQRDGLQARASTTNATDV